MSSRWIDLLIVMKWSFCSLVILFALKSTLCDIIIAAPAFFWLVLLWYIFFYTFTLNLFVSSYLKNSILYVKYIWVLFYLPVRQILIVLFWLLLLMLLLIWVKFMCVLLLLVFYLSYVFFLSSFFFSYLILGFECTILIYYSLSSNELCHITYRRLIHNYTIYLSIIYLHVSPPNLYAIVVIHFTYI